VSETGDYLQHHDRVDGPAGLLRYHHGQGELFSRFSDPEAEFLDVAGTKGIHDMKKKRLKMSSSYVFFEKIKIAFFFSFSLLLLIG
jgi:hypothetical protein